MRCAPSPRRASASSARPPADSRACCRDQPSLLSSPYVRARDTAALLAAALGRKKVIECGELAAGVPAHEVFTLLRARKERTVILVGHEPNLSHLLSACLDEQARIKFEFKKGGAACVEFGSRVQPGHATLRWMLPPRVLKALR